MKYPTREGIAISPLDLDLPESNLNLGKSKNFNNHHHEWTRKKMGEFLITQTLRDLSRHQTVLPKDIHQWIHDTYDPPHFPTPEQAMKEVMDAYESGDTLSVYSIDQKRYVRYGFPETLIDNLKNEYSYAKS